MSNERPTDPRPITEARLLAMVNASGDSYWETDADRRFVNVSENLCRLMGYSRSELRGRSVLEFMSREYGAEVAHHAQLRAAQTGSLLHVGPLRHEGEFFRKDGLRLWIETVSVPVFDDGGAHIGYFGITRDSTERKRAEQSLREANRQLEMQLVHIRQLHEQMREQAIRDDLTGLHNRRYFIETAELALQRAREQGTALSLVMLDIDHFKSVNDRHGHSTGDLALKAVASMLGATRRLGDTVCRLGGEEFAAMLVGADHDAAMALAEQWRSALSRLIVAGETGSVTLTASFGVATVSPQADTLVELMKLADLRMYQAKSGGRDRVAGERGA